MESEGESMSSTKMEMGTERLRWYSAAKHSGGVRVRCGDLKWDPIGFHVSHVRHGRFQQGVEEYRQMGVKFHLNLGSLWSLAPAQLWLSSWGVT